MILCLGMDHIINWRLKYYTYHSWHYVLWLQCIFMIHWRITSVLDKITSWNQSLCICREWKPSTHSYPSDLQIISPALYPKLSSHTVPHSSSYNTSIRPEAVVVPFTSRNSTKSGITATEWNYIIFQSRQHKNTWGAVQYVTSLRKAKTKNFVRS